MHIRLRLLALLSYNIHYRIIDQVQNQQSIINKSLWLAQKTILLILEKSQQFPQECDRGRKMSGRAILGKDKERQAQPTCQHTTDHHHHRHLLTF